MTELLRDSDSSAPTAAPRTATPSTHRDTFVVSRIACESAHGQHDDCEYRVAWRINPHMRIGAVDGARARRQHNGFTGALRALGAHVAEVPFVHGAFDSVFAKDNAVLVSRGGQRRALLARPRFAERHAEQAPRALALEAYGFEVEQADGPSLEGGDVVMLPNGKGALLGHGFRSSRHATDGLAQFLGAPVLPLELRDEGLYHLDTALAVLGDGTALVCADALTPASLRALERHDAVRRVVFVPRAEAMRFGVNLVEVGETLVLGGPAPTVVATAAARARRTRICPLGEFQLAGGSAACLVSRVHSLDARVAEAAATSSRAA